ncbi:uncharacterized protein [Procambarus clarkii]|uniref:uncharacterized protein n=1 Tax=Procambarus clarkii TaxID=6728 RepID=UPI001E671AB4|nr:uncharacterized protein LOC123759317 [Procambarus clarkii]
MDETDRMWEAHPVCKSLLDLSDPKSLSISVPSRGSPLTTHGFPVKCQTDQVSQCSNFYTPNFEAFTCYSNRNVKWYSDQHAHDQLCEEKYVFAGCQRTQSHCADKFLVQCRPKFNPHVTHGHNSDPTLPLHQDSPTKQSESQGVTELMSIMQKSRSKSRARVSLPSRSETMLTEEELRSALPARDINEILHLQKSHRDAFSFFPLPEIVNGNEVDSLWQLYSLFVERQSSFYTQIPLFRLLAASDRQKLLSLAVGISTHVSAAQLMDDEEYTWPRKDAPPFTNHTKVLSATTIRQIVSHDHFVLLMTFYMHYTRLFADPRVALLTQVLTLFCQEPELIDADAVKCGRQHYLGLLTRYLTAVYGSQRGADMLRSLLISQEEARQLTVLYHHVELAPQAQKNNVRDITNTIAINFQKVCVIARDTALKVKNRRHLAHETDGEVAQILHNNSEELTLVNNLLVCLAECDDPHMLAAARHLLPQDLLQRFLQLVQ